MWQRALLALPVLACGTSLHDNFVEPRDAACGSACVHDSSAADARADVSIADASRDVDADAGDVSVTPDGARDAGVDAARDADAAPWATTRCTIDTCFEVDGAVPEGGLCSAIGTTYTCPPGGDGVLLYWKDDSGTSAVCGTVNGVRVESGGACVGGALSCGVQWPFPSAQNDLRGHCN